MESLIAQIIEEEARKRLRTYFQKLQSIRKNQKRFRIRTNLEPKAGTVKFPAYWEFHKHFDPRYCIKHSNFIAKGIWKSLKEKKYAPVPAFRIKHKKKSGDFRSIDIFSIPDAAVAKIFFKLLRQRNAKIFSDSSYAYQAQKTPLDAVIKIKISIQNRKIFISQYDFKNFFDSIPHSYLQESLSKDSVFLTTSMERHVINSVINHSYTEDGKGIATRICGVPQGNSISLFLANVAAHYLDTELSKLSGTFARFADDSVLINYRYDDALDCENSMSLFSENSKIQLNRQKSGGIAIFSQRSAEMKTVNFFDFLSYRFLPDKIQPSPKSIAAIKRRCSRIIYNNLLLYPRRVNAVSIHRFGTGFIDWDLVTCINELRRYIYSRRPQHEIDRVLLGEFSIRNMGGPVSYFCLVPDGTVFRELDGWLSDVVHRAYKKRLSLVRSLSVECPTKEVSKKSLLDGSWYKYESLPQEAKLPSFFTAWRVARLSWSRHGLGGVDPRGMVYAYSLQ